MWGSARNLAERLPVSFDSLKPGDILAFSSPTALGRAIQIATLGRYNHVGIVGTAPHCVGPLLFESTADATEPCAIRGVRVMGVQVHPALERIRIATDAGQKVYRLSLCRPVTSDRYDEEFELRSFLRSRLGTPYDFTGALRARTLGFGWVRWLLPSREATGDLFCAELVAMALRVVRRFNTRNCSAWSPSALVRALVRRGVTERPRLLGRDGA
jgi:hypothetical protein